MGAERAADLLAQLRAELAAEGLFIVRPVAPAGLERAGVGVALADLLPGGRSGVVIGDGGGRFFARFQRSTAQDPAASDPLDRYTAQVVPAAVTRALGEGRPFTVRYPFLAAAHPLPFQRLGQAGGLPAPGPLGLQVHPEFGPWWAYRAFLVLAEQLPEEPPLAASCPGCPAPCVAACPVDALAGGGLDVERCASQRLSGSGCAQSCAARRACVVGTAHQYPDEQLAFHMDASLASLAAYYRSRTLGGSRDPSGGTGA